MEHPIGATFRFCFLLIKDKRHFFDGVYTFSLFFFSFRNVYNYDSNFVTVAHNLYLLFYFSNFLSCV